MKFNIRQSLVSLLVAAVFFLFTGVLSVVMAATLKLNTVAGISVGTLMSVTTSDTTPTLVGAASPEATVDISIDDLTVAVLADASGNWSYTPLTALSNNAHTLTIASNLETLNYVLIVSSGTSTATTSTTTTTTTTTTLGVGGATESSSTTLPVSGGLTNTFLLMIGGLFLIGLGLVTQQFSPAFNEVEEIELKPQDDLNQEIDN